MAKLDRRQVPGLTPPDLKAYKSDNKGAAIEVRLNAENPSTGFSPSSGEPCCLPSAHRSPSDLVISCG